MTESLSIAVKVQQASQYSRDQKLRRRAALFLRALELGSIAQACREFGTSPQLYHYWWRRFQKSGFQKEALKEKSRRPHHSPRKVSTEAVRWIGRFRKAGHKAEKIRLLLEKDKKQIISLPTVYRVLAREGLVRKKKVKKERKGSGVLKHQASPLPRKIADRYKVIRALGSGGGGTVFLVEDTKREAQKVALKFLEIRKETDPSLIDHLKNEFIALASLQHPHLAKVHDLVVGSKEIFFTSEFIQGQDLLTAVQGADLNLIFQWIVQILSALDTLHRKGIVHRDLKPTNIMVCDPDAAGEVSAKLIDFGSADCRRTSQAAPGELMGTPPYVAPEILMEQPAGPASDLYSLGILLHQIFFKAYPFRTKDLTLMIQEQIYQEPLRLEGLPPSLPAEFGDLLFRLVARDPKERFQSAAQLLEGINQVLGENFSLRPPRSPLRILEESDFAFRPETLAGLLLPFEGRRPQLVVLSGPEGSGKSRLLRELRETFQARGVFPSVFEDLASLLESLKSPIRPGRPPSLVDVGEGESLSKILEALDEAGQAALICTRREKSPELFAHHWIDLAPLPNDRILSFFKKEILDFPFRDPGHPLIGMSGGNPARLETILKALEEEGVLQWTDQGWRWREELSLDLEGLLKRHEQRWSERRERVCEILSLSKLVLSAETLGGLLGLSPGELGEWLQTWAGQGIFKTRLIKKIPHYSLKEISEQKQAAFGEDWDQLRRELERLYEEGSFEAGSCWADLILSQRREGQVIPSPILLLSARHYAAARQSQKVLRILSQIPFEEQGSGLFHETRARAQLALGDLKEMGSDLRSAQGLFEQEKNPAGLSRVFNLEGLLLKREGDFSGAQTALKRSIERAEQGGDIYLKGLAEMNLGLHHQERGEFPQALNFYDAALISAERAQHPLLSARLKQNRLNLLFAMGQAGQAEKACYELLRLSLPHHYKELTASAFNFLALLAGQKEQKDLQLNFLNQALGLLRSHELWFPYTQTLINRSFFFWEQHRFTPAELDAEYALSLAKRQKNPLFTAWSHLLLGRILRDRPRPDLSLAEEYLARAYQDIYKVQNRPLFWEVEFDRGLLAKRKGEGDKARGFFESARAHLDELLLKVPDSVRQSYLRDRKMERIEEEISKS